jgi:hypothetical protein
MPALQANRGPRFRLKGGVVLAAASLFLTACGSDSSSDASGSAGDLPALRWSANTININQAIFYAAMGRGSFESAGLDVSFVPAQSNSAALVTGTTDVIVGRLADSLGLLEQGKSVKVLAKNGGSPPLGLLANNDVESLDALAAMGSNCRIATLPTGGVPLAVNHFVEKYGLDCKLSTVADYKLTVDGTIAGNFTATVQTPGTGGAAIGSGKAHWLIDPADPNWEADGNRPPVSIIGSSVATTADYNDDHSEELEIFMGVLQDTETWMKTAPNEEIAQAILDSGVAFWTTQTVEAITDQLTSNGSFKDVFSSTLGGEGVDPITAEEWQEQLDNGKYQGVEIDIADPKYSYAEVYDGQFAVK